MKTWYIREAEFADAEKILALIKELAAYEKLEDQVTATIHDLVDVAFRKKTAHILVADDMGAIVGYALWFYNVSTFKCKNGIYLEDVFVRESCRHKGIGRAFLAELAKIAEAEELGRIEWACLDWNEPSKRFYEKLGAQPVGGWTQYRVDESGFSDFIESCEGGK